MANGPTGTPARPLPIRLLLGVAVLVALGIGFLIWYLPRASEPMSNLTPEQKAAAMRKANRSIRPRQGSASANVSH